MAQTSREMHRELAERMPDYYADLIRSGKIITESDQRRLASMGMETLFPHVMFRTHAYCMGIYPENASPEMDELDRGVVTALNSVKGLREEDLKIVRKELGKRAKLIELTQQCGDFYTQEPRENDSAMETGKVEFKVKRAISVPGPRFFATDIGGYHGILRYFVEEVASIAPQRANAYLTGDGFLVTVENRQTNSPIVADRIIGPISLKDDMYHVIPVQFFNVNVDRSQKFTSDWEVTEKSRDGQVLEITRVVKPRN